MVFSWWYWYLSPSLVGVGHIAFENECLNVLWNLTQIATKSNIYIYIYIFFLANILAVSSNQLILLDVLAFYFKIQFLKNLEEIESNKCLKTTKVSIYKDIRVFCHQGLFIYLLVLANSILLQHLFNWDVKVGHNSIMHHKQNLRVDFWICSVMASVSPAQLVENVEHKWSMVIKFVHARVSLDILVKHNQPRKEPKFLNQLNWGKQK